ncbi:MAG TPA: hypothetical protein VHU23_10040 [Rhizomicrobium sp.]|jgi:hypothetical protein|nr:hypothetical protein [Rhizomicrobium sp.]
MSDKPIAERLQVRNGRMLAIMGAPPDVDRSIGTVRAKPAQADVLLAFAKNNAELNKRIPQLLGAPATAILWLAYPKLTSSLAGNLNREAVRKCAAAQGLDTVSQIAIDEDWSAMRLKRVA